MRDENYKLKKYAESDSPPKLSDRKIYTGVYRGIRFEINNFNFGPIDTESRWTHYIYIALDQQLEKELADKFWLEGTLIDGGNKYLRHDYYGSVIDNLEFHGGCTYYSKEAGFEGEPRVVKIGCDYQHLWDQDKQYDLSYIYAEVIQTIDSLYRLANNKIKIRSWGDGQYRYLEEFE